MMDVFQRSMDTSDPLISSISIKKRAARHKKNPLPRDVIELLETPHYNFPINVQSLSNDYSFHDDSDSEIDDINPYAFELDVENN